MEFLERYDSQQLYSNFYFLFGRVEFVVQAAPGPGIISDMMTLSDDLDELDWEFRGSLDDEVQTGWFGKGVTGLYNHSITPKIPTPMTQFHTYTFDWTPERVIWEDDGAVVRTLYASDCIGTANQYPQTPMKLMMGLWDAGDPDHYDPWAAGMTPVPPPEGGYSFYVKSVKIWNNNPAGCYNWTDHSGSWQSISALKDSSACGITPKSSSTILSSSSATSARSSLVKSTSTSSASSSSTTVVSSTSSTSPSSMIASSSLDPSSSSKMTSPLASSPLSILASSSSSAISSSSTIASSSPAFSSFHQSSTSGSIPLLPSLSQSSMRMTTPTQSGTTDALSSKVSSSQASSKAQGSSTSASNISSLVVHTSSAQVPSTSSISVHQSSSQSSNTNSLKTQSGSTQPSTADPSSIISFTPLKESTHVSAPTPSSPFLSSTMSNPVLSSRTSAGQSLKSTTAISPGSQTSTILQALSGKASTSSLTTEGSLIGFTATGPASSRAPNAISIPTGTSSKLLSSTSKGIPSTGLVHVSPTVSPGHISITTGSVKNSLLHTSAVPGRSTITIVVQLPGHQTISYNPVVEDLTELVLSLEKLIQGHRSKRDLRSPSPEPDGSILHSNLADVPAQRHGHGHQYDHLHELHRGRGLDNSDHAALTNDVAASLNSGPFALAGTRTDVAVTEDGEPTATLAGMSEATSLGGQSVDESAGSSISSPPLVDGQDLHLKGAMRQTVVPESLLADQFAVSQPAPTDSGTRSRSVKAAIARTQSVSHQDFSAAARVAPFAKSDLGVRAMIYGLWVFSFILCYY